ncbi:hypothetical protein GGP96_003208 [Salinibacter ruber]|uniref:hypothetical protein n=1 Tax=Salinibacter ruber TaxID=146919 RepID=UPI002168D77A|nr:hypothetical protein [Salinibacter ruber]
MTKRRFSAGDSTYYVPYDGEETLLHWANREQYYIKTTEHFRDYRFTARDTDVHFRLVDAQVPQDNVKAGDTRYFVLQGDDPVTVDPDAGTCTVQFAYRPITEEEDERLLALYNEDKSSSNTRKTNDRRTIVAATSTGRPNPWKSSSNAAWIPPRDNHPPVPPSFPHPQTLLPVSCLPTPLANSRSGSSSRHTSETSSGWPTRRIRAQSSGITKACGRPRRDSTRTARRTS